MSRSAIVLYVSIPQIIRHWQATACPRAARKSATYRSPRSPILAALVPSVGTITLQIELRSRAGAMNARASEHCRRTAASHRRAKLLSSSATMTVPYYISENKSDIRGIKHGWYAIEDDGNLSSGPFPSFEDCVARISQPTNGTMATKLQRGPN